MPTILNDFGTSNAVSIDATEVRIMENTHSEKRCRLLGSIRDHNGRIRFGEEPTILREVDNLDRHMFLVRFDDGATTFLFPHEVALS